MQLRIDLHSEAFEPLGRLEQWRTELIAQGSAAGDTCAAESLFIGRVRATAADGNALIALELQHYPGMTERQLCQLAESSCGRHGAYSCLIQHRIGRVLPGEAIVLVAIGADRRGPAQSCCQELLEALKHEAPFWKREWRSDGTGEWLTGNTPL
ncbi:molybdenum cofactor biosynthesis protein MoaE [Cyanobium sp. WAJ14-Wanaka]|uniref:molybdopterin synthase catalytic subunit n=1 Tax=Cyanobium sp. WAJ14-Wanaka TaxID=2823725 RepID=UPI0020CEE99D|nr:molybdenum cofactor biosynthesis protein MoaE [Cyanobium sp. WAJ14-Wanaka]MCP9775513.1 molybdenum cofactor biosynthesis protein MoaE [Cyanobium sp. WAJ14-Wanaka]